MSTLIKGMEMPTSCSDCPMLDWDLDYIKCKVTGRHFKVKEEPFGARRVDDCPLVPVPPHGDLIDREETLHKLSNEKVKDIKPNMTWGEIDELIALDIVTMPTIIHAEEGE